MLTDLARQIAPQDIPPEVPLYILRPSQGLPPELASYPAMGLHASWLDVAARDWLQAQGRWRGRGPAVWLNDSLLGETSLRDASGDRHFAGELFRGRIVAVFCHELAHLLGRPLELDETAYPDHAVVEMHQALADPKPSTTDAPPPEPWDKHRADFLRVLCHVAHRAEKLLGGRLPEPWLLGRCYSLSPLFCYSHAIENELESWAGDSFAAIRETPLPKSLLTLWRADVAAYLKENRELHFGKKEMRP